MSYNAWYDNILRNRELVLENLGYGMIATVSGSLADTAYWNNHLQDVSRDIFRADGKALIHSVYEKSKKGNFLGTLNAWLDIKRTYNDVEKVSNIILISMVFGQGKRLSPFTQSLGNRKAAFLTPFKTKVSNTNLCIADLSNLYANTWMQHLNDNGFHGAVLKWGDEAIIPGKTWQQNHHNGYQNIDALRFVWKTDVTETLAREKEWILIDNNTELMTFQYSRQDIELLRKRLAETKSKSYQVGVNLGSLAISYDFLNIASEVLYEDIINSNIWADWDPYVWIALFCRDESEWNIEKTYEEQIGKTGIRDIEKIYPKFFQKIQKVRSTLEAKTGRSLAVGVLDLGEPLWIDMGLHITLRQTLEALISNTQKGEIIRELFGIDNSFDENGNIIIRSSIPETANIYNSVIIDTTITSSDSVIHNGLVVGGKHHHLEMFYGGSALFCVADKLVFKGSHGIAFRLVGSEFEIPEGGRYTTLFLPQGPECFISNEKILDYNGKNYSQPILGNRFSFEEAGKLMSQLDVFELERQWSEGWCRVTQ